MAVQWRLLHTGVLLLIGEVIEPTRLEAWLLKSKAGGVKVGCKWRRGRAKVNKSRRRL
jgi:hypothetical protein